MGVDVAAQRQFVFDAGGEVVGAVRWRGVHGAGTLLGGDVVGKDAEDAAVEEGVGEGGAFELRAGEASNLSRILEITALVAGFARGPASSRATM